MAEPITEPPWLTAAVDQRLALMKDKLGNVDLSDQAVVMMTPLTEPAENANAFQMARWEHTCDNCGEYTPQTMRTGHVIRRAFGVKVTITFGACPKCMGLEA